MLQYAPFLLSMLWYAHPFISFDYKIVHHYSNNHVNADYYSRNPLPLISFEVQIIDDKYAFQENVIKLISMEILTSEHIHEETFKDKELSVSKTKILNVDTMWIQLIQK